MATACASKIMVVLLFVSLGLLRSVLSFSIYTLKDTQTSKSLKSAYFKERDTESVDAINIPLLRRNAAEISHSFVTKESNPAWFAKNNHLQTITGVFSREDSAYFPPTGNQILKKFEWDDRERVETHDGDFFFVDWKFCASDDRVGRPSTEAPVVLICHGLQSNSDSLLVKDMAITSLIQTARAINAAVKVTSLRTAPTSNRRTRCTAVTRQGGAHDAGPTHGSAIRGAA